MLFKVKIFVLSRKPCWHVRRLCLAHTCASGTCKNLTVSTALDLLAQVWRLLILLSSPRLLKKLQLPSQSRPVCWCVSPCPQDSPLPVITAVVSIPSLLFGHSGQPSPVLWHWTSSLNLCWPVSLSVMMLWKHASNNDCKAFGEGW